MTIFKYIIISIKILLAKIFESISATVRFFVGRLADQKSESEIFEVSDLIRKTEFFVKLNAVHNRQETN
jgi:hypothetical protein